MNKLFFILYLCWLSNTFHGQEISSDKSKRINVGLTALISGTEYLQNYNPSGSFGFNIRFRPSRIKRLSFESGLYFSSRTLFVNKNYTLVKFGDPMFQDLSYYNLHSLIFFNTEVPLIINYVLNKRDKKTLFFVSSGVLTSFRLGVYSKFTRDYEIYQRFSSSRISRYGIYSIGVASPLPVYDFSVLIGTGLNFKQKYFIGLFAQKGFITLKQFVNEQQGGCFNALSFKITHMF